MIFGLAPAEHRLRLVPACVVIVRMAMMSCVALFGEIHSRTRVILIMLTCLSPKSLGHAMNH